MASSETGNTTMNQNCDDDECIKPIYENGRYRNPWDTWREISFPGLLNFVFVTKSEANIPNNKVELDKTLPVKIPNLSEFSTSPASGIRHMWIGHASSLVQFDGITLLTDPIFSDRCSPSQLFGTKRYRPPPCRIEDLPEVDCVLISHNHYDHLDLKSVHALNKKFGDKLRWYVPMGLKNWMHDCGVKNVVELSWWQEHVHNEKPDVKIVSTPCQHWCKRGLNDTNMVLWTSWCVIGPNHRFYFAGDTGYCPGFKQIGKRYGPFTLSTIPIGAYHPRSFLSPQHVDPAQAVDIHKDVVSQKSIGIHWGTFSLSNEFYLEPKEALKEELQKRGLDPESFITVNHGEITVVEGHTDVKS